MIEFLRTLPMSVSGAARRLVRVRARSRRRSAPAASATSGRGRARAARRSCCCTTWSARRRARCAARLPWRDGPGRVHRRRGARCAAARRRRSAPGAEVTRIRVQDDAVAGVVLADGEEIAAPRGALHRRSRAARLLELGRSGVARSRVPARGAATSATAAAPRSCSTRSTRLPEVPRAGLDGCARRHRLAVTPSSSRSSAPPTPPSTARSPTQPHVEITVPTLRWPELAPDGQHVLVARAQYAPYRLRDGRRWDVATARGAGGHRDARRSKRRSPGFRRRVLHRVALVAARSRGALRRCARAPLTQGELALDQILFMRPVAGWGRHATPIAGLYLGRSRHPSRAPASWAAPGWLAAQRLLARSPETTARTCMSVSAAPRRPIRQGARTMPGEYYTSRGDSRRGARADLRAALELRRPRHARWPSPGDYFLRDDRGRVDHRAARPRGHAARLLQRLPPPRHADLQRGVRALRRDDPVPVPRLDLHAPTDG